MSLNRDLVVFYITYKLSQRNYPLDHLGLLYQDQEAEAGGLDARVNGMRNVGSPPPRSSVRRPMDASDPAPPSETRDASDPAPPSETRDASDPAPPSETRDASDPAPPSETRDASDPAPPSETRDASDPAPPSETRDASDPAPPSETRDASDPAPPSETRGASNPAPLSSPPSAALPSTVPPAVDLQMVKEALRDSANEFELRFSRAFSDLHRQLHITPATAYRSFENVMDEVFRDGVNWGRVVGLFAFGGALCVECVEKEMSPLVLRIVEWMTVYLDNHIQDWITSQGGWGRFAEIYGQDMAADTRRSEESLKKWLWAGVTLVTGVVVGSLIAQKRL